MVHGCSLLLHKCAPLNQTWIWNVTREPIWFTGAHLCTREHHPWTSPVKQTVMECKMTPWFVRVVTGSNRRRSQMLVQWIYRPKWFCKNFKGSNRIMFYKNYSKWQNKRIIICNAEIRITWFFDETRPIIHNYEAFFKRKNIWSSWGIFQIIYWSFSLKIYYCRS